MNKLRVVVFSVAAIGLSAFAAQLPMSEEMLKVTGGRLEKPGSQKGAITFVYCQSSAERAWIEEVAKHFVAETNFKIDVAEGKFDIKAPAIVGEASVFIVEDPELPMSLVAPESRWAVMNVDKLKSEKRPFYEARVKKELTRVFAMLCGATDSSYNGALTGPVTKVKDLDRHVDYKLPVDVISRFQKYMPAFGVTPAKLVTYRSACKQGWAPAPTNDYQKAVWEEYHTLPTKGLEIKYDPEKGE